MSLQYTVWGSAAEVAHGPVLNEDIIAIGAGSVQSPSVIDASAVNVKTTRRVRVMCETNAYVTWGTNPTAVATGTGGRMMGAENPEYFDMEAGFLIAAIERV